MSSTVGLSKHGGRDVMIRLRTCFLVVDLEVSDVCAVGFEKGIDVCAKS